MSAMHAALDRLGVGMPCGLIARLQETTAAKVEDAIEKARPRFPVLQCRVAWLGSRPVLVPIEPECQDQARASEISLTFESNAEKPLWRYRLVQEGDDVWLNAVWDHAAADGHSMLRLMETIVAVLAGRSLAHFRSRLPPRGRRRPMAAWLIRFIIEQHLPHVRPTEEGLHPPGVAWLTVPAELSSRLRQKAHTECGSFAAWLAGAASMAYCEQQGVPSGRVMLDVPILRDHLDRVNGFGFGVGSLLMPVKVNLDAPLTSVAHLVAARLKEMINQRWDENFERFLGNNPSRHLRFAALRARGLHPPVITVSWKGAHWGWGAEDGIRDVACFAVPSAAHISSHIDRNGLSLSVTSKQPAAMREDLLRRIVARLGCGTVERILSFEGHSCRPIRCVCTTDAPLSETLGNS